MLNKSISYRLTLFISVAVINVFIAFMAISYFFNYNALNKSIESKAISLSTDVISKIEQKLTSTEEISQVVAEQVIFYAKNRNSEMVLSDILKKYPFFKGIHVNIDSAFINSKYSSFHVFRDNTGINFEKQNNITIQCNGFKRLIKQFEDRNTPSWSDVIECARTKEKIVAFYYPVFIETADNSTQRIGEVVSELNIKELNEAIKNIEVANNGFVLLITKDGNYISHPDSKKFIFGNAFDVDSKVYDKKKYNINEIITKGLNGSAISYPAFRNYEKHWSYYTKIKGMDWFLIVGMPYKMLFSSVHLTALIMLLVSLTGILAIYFIVRHIANRLVEPLSHITTKLKEFTANEAEEFRLNTYNEVKLVSESLNFIESWYKEFKTEQTKEQKKNQSRMNDLVQASEIQQGLINTAFSNISKSNEVDFHGLYKPAKVVSGDLFDFFYLDDDHVLFTMGDVSGKGIPAALFMSISQTIIKNNAKIGDVRKIVSNSNNELNSFNEHQFFLTLFLGILNLKSGKLEYCNAAHTPAYILKHNNYIVELKQTHGLPLGLYKNKPYLSSMTDIEEGDVIVLYTDGITDQRNENKILYGQQRLVENLRHLTAIEPREIVNSIYENLKVFRGSVQQSDDIAFIAIKYNGKKKPD